MAGLIGRLKGAARALLGREDPGLAAARFEVGRLRRERRELAYAGAATTSWMPVLESCQSEIAKLDDVHPNYRAAYRAEELSYWLHVPGWLAAQLRRRRAGAGGRCLDVGCAYGTLARLAQEVGGLEVHATDFIDAYLSPTLVARHGWAFEVHNLELGDLPWPDLRFDVILFTEVLEHLNFTPVPSLMRLRQRLAPGGRLYLTTPDASEWGRVTRYYPSLASIPDAAPDAALVDDHVWQYDEEELRAVVAEAGLAIERFALAPGSPNRHFNLELSAG